LAAAAVLAAAADDNPL